MGASEQVLLQRWESHWALADWQRSAMFVSTSQASFCQLGPGFHQLVSYRHHLT